MLTFVLRTETGASAEREGHWHVGEPWPKFTRRIFLIQADGDEMDLILGLLETRGVSIPASKALCDIIAEILQRMDRQKIEMVDNLTQTSLDFYRLYPDIPLLDLLMIQITAIQDAWMHRMSEVDFSREAKDKGGAKAHGGMERGPEWKRA